VAKRSTKTKKTTSTAPAKGKALTKSATKPVRAKAKPATNSKPKQKLKAKTAVVSPVAVTVSRKNH